MYILGHWAATRASQAFEPGALTGDGMVALMLPDVARCHEWGYATCFDASGDADPSHRLMRAHMLGDWYVHYGSGRERIRRGWAYRTMGVFARLYREFFETAEEAGMRPRGASRDSVRGFSHTMVEYSIDTWVADSLPEAAEGFAAAKEALADLPLPTLTATLDAAGADYPLDKLGEGARSFSRRVRAADRPQELAYRAGVKKFGLSGDSAVAYVESFIRRGMQEIPRAEFDSTFAGTARFIAEHLHPMKSPQPLAEARA